MTMRIDAIRTGLVIVLLAGLALTVTAAGTYREVLSAGQKKLQAKDYAGAKAEAAEAQKLAGSAAEKTEALLLLAQTLAAAGDNAGARECYEQILKSPDLPALNNNAEALLGAARTYEAETNWPAARREYEKVLKREALSEKVKAQAQSGMIRLMHLNAEEGTVRDGMNSCDPFGLPRQSQQIQFEAKTAAYLKAYPDAKFALGVETPVRKIFRDKLWFRGEYADQVALSAARNEYEAFQLCVIPLGLLDPEAIKGVKLSATDLVSETGAKIPAANVKIWQVGYVRTRPPSYPTCHVGYWPDPLLEHAAPLEVAGHQLQVFWIRVQVSEKTDPGQYKGSINVATTTHGSRNLTLNLRVRPFTLPEDSKLIFQAMRYVGMGPYMNYYKINKDAALDMVTRYAEVLIREYKLFPCQAGFYDKNDQDFARFDALIQPFMQKGMKLCSSLPNVKVEGLRNGVEPAEFKRLTDHLRQKGWLPALYLYLSDEPAEEDYPKLREYVGKVREMVPDIKILTGESPNPGLAGFTDAWWSDVSTEDPVYNRERQQAGDLVLWYFCRVPVRMDRIFNSIWDAPLMLIDRAATEQRVVFWLAWKYKMDGIMIWAANGSWYKDGKTTWPEEPWDPYLDIYDWPYGGADNGNGVLFYPGKQGPLPSLRLEVLREGREDYEYLWLLNSLAGNNPPEEIKQALSVNPLVCITPHLFTKDPAAFYKERDRIAELIERYQKKGTP